MGAGGAAAASNGSGFAPANGSGFGSGTPIGRGGTPVRAAGEAGAYFALNNGRQPSPPNRAPVGGGGRGGVALMGRGRKPDGGRFGGGGEGVAQGIGGGLPGPQGFGSPAGLAGPHQQPPPWQQPPPPPAMHHQQHLNGRHPPGMVCTRPATSCKEGHNCACCVHTDLTMQYES
jgi:hypothetical protein